ncbi:MAG: BT0820 family HAD-type phosphatase, partial [Flavobacteriales bacterium]
MDEQQSFITADSLTIAVDFDGTIVEHAYPGIGKEMLFAFDTLKALQKKGHKLILWTIRSGELLDEAVEYCRQNGVEFYAVNANFPEETDENMHTRKLNADLYIDDRNVGGFLGWGEIWNLLYPGTQELDYQLNNPDAHNNYRKQGFWKRLF